MDTNPIFLNLQKEKKIKFKEIIRKYNHVFRKTVTPLPRSAAEFRIDTGDARPREEKWMN